MSTLPATLSPLLAAMPADPAQRTGYIVGFVIGVAVMLGLVAFGVLSVVMAFVRRTKVWIVLGSLSGVVLLVAGVALVAAFAMGATKGFQQAMASRAAAKSEQKVIGQKLPFTLDLPPGWAVKRGEGQFDFVANRGGTEFVGVIAEEMNVGDPDRVANFAREHLKGFATDVTLGEVSSITLDGREWRQFTVKAKVQAIPFAYQYYVYSGEEGTFQILGWTFQNLWERRAETLREVMQKFQFPPAEHEVETKDEEPANLNEINAADPA